MRKCKRANAFIYLYTTQWKSQYSTGHVEADRTGKTKFGNSQRTYGYGGHIKADRTGNKPWKLTRDTRTI